MDINELRNIYKARKLRSNLHMLDDDQLASELKNYYSENLRQKYVDFVSRIPDLLISAISRSFQNLSEEEKTAIIIKLEVFNVDDDVDFNSHADEIRGFLEAQNETI